MFLLDTHLFAEERDGCFAYCITVCSIPNGVDIRSVYVTIPSHIHLFSLTANIYFMYMTKCTSFNLVIVNKFLHHKPSNKH